jgi:hypothetical protein
VVECLQSLVFGKFPIRRARRNLQEFVWEIGVRIETQVMTADQVRELIRVQSADNLRTINDHRISLEQALVTPQRISIIARQVADGRLRDQTINVWPVGREDSSDGYKIITRDDGSQFGLGVQWLPERQSSYLGRVVR